MIFRSIFLILAAILVTCIISGMRAERRNWGFILNCVLAIICNVICFFLVESKGIREARTALVAYYASHGWFCFFTLWMIVFSGKHNKLKLALIPSGIISLTQTVIVLMTLWGHRLISYSKHIVWGRSWWVASPSLPESPILDFVVYYRGFTFNVIIIFVVTIFCCLRTAKLYRGKYYVFLIQQFIITCVEMAFSMLYLPVWVNAVVMTIMCCIYVFFIKHYNRIKLREWSFRTFANEMSDGYILYDEYDRLVHMNEVVTANLPAGLIKDFSDRNKLDEWISSAIDVEGIEVLHCHLDEKDTYYKARKNELMEHGVGMGTIYILHDTTESINQIRVMREANAELERAAQMKSDFLANMSHEIRTPMNAVIGMAEIALRDTMSDNVRDYLMQIQNSGKNLLNIINDILDFSKIEAGKMEIMPERYEPLSELADIANVLVTRIGDKELELFVTCATDIPRILEGDAMRIRQIIINLANNAIKFTRKGVVNIRVSCEKKSDDEVIMTYHVVDTGVGIRPEDMDKLFVSFQQLDSKRNRAVEGTGLGLVISQKLCMAMGGTLNVESEYGKGSDFYFSIPQKVLDPSLDLVVKDAQNKFAYCLNENVEMCEIFVKEVNRLGVQGRAIKSLAEYTPVSSQDFLFFAEDGYDRDVKAFLEEHNEVIGVNLVSFGSDFESDLPNLRIMRRPETTLGMVNTLNNMATVHRYSESAGAFVIDFTAPDARILIVDDNAINITIAKGLLAPIGAVCDGALSGREAIKMLRRKDYDLVFMDHMMPELDGVDTTRIIRQDVRRADKVPIIALSANAMEDAKLMFRQAGMNDFVAKPIDVRHLVHCVRKWLPQNKIIEDVNDGQARNTLDGVVGSLEHRMYAGLDSVSAINSLGSADLYEKIVGEYYRGGREKYELIQKAFSNEDWEDYTIRVHALKSSSRQIGAMELGELAQEMEFAGKSGDIDAIRAKTPALMDSYRAVLEGLSFYFEEEEKDESVLEPIPEGVFLEILDELAEACDSLDMDVMDDVDARLKNYSFADRTEDIKALVHAMDNLDVEGCMSIIDELRASLSK
ncbi:MAG: response regulator [Lachnospiraceae bacterium]|nr:response regulator [Lachnospiraceae bacterium]